MTHAPAPTGTRTRWRNWAGNQRAEVEVLHPASAAEVTDLVTAAAAAGRRVRPIGSGHSFAAIGRPEDLQLACGRLDAIGEIGADGLVTVGGGTTLHRLNAELVRSGWSLTNLGNVDRQTVAGALATGTHALGRASVGWLRRCGRWSW